MTISSTKGAPKLVFDTLCAVYDEDSFEVIHFHRVATLEGGMKPSSQEVRARAMEHAKSRGLAPSRKLASLIVEPASFQPGCMHHVDAAARRLIARRVVTPS
jgi:hypothetical protein